MAFINAQLNDVREAEAVPEGEYDLRILKAERRDSKGGNPMTAITIKIEDSDYPNAQLVNHFLLDVTKDTPDNQVQMRKLELKRFLTVFNIPHNDDGYDTDDLPGAEGRCTLIQEEGDDKNIYNRLRLPKLKS